jgi:hypothetical protein
VASACRLFREKIGAHDLTDQVFYFFLLPFPSVEDLRLRFARARGILA